MIADDLGTGWDSPHPQRCLAMGNLDALHPLSELPHPIITKARECFGHDPADDNFVGPITSSTHFPLMEIKNSQWRGGVWTDPETGVRWLVVAGLAKGGHRDREDFYQRVHREDEAGTTERWLPTVEDSRLLKRETAASLRTEWELGVQRQVLDALMSVHAGGTFRTEVMHPLPERGAMGSLEVTVTAVREEDYEADELDVEVAVTNDYAGSALAWQLVVRVLISLEPPEQGWNRFRDTYSNVGEPGRWRERVGELRPLVDAAELAVSSPGATSHLAHQKHLAGSTVDGRAVRALCGVYFVPTQDHDSMPPCASCQTLYAELPE